MAVLSCNNSSSSRAGEGGATTKIEAAEEVRAKARARELPTDSRIPCNSNSILVTKV